ncbi:hypothetical protein [Flavobacterium sp. ASW18X]|uniref:hypothetical protein n=1 Tax=Flavobacterium sp. ASW18X TaxID=2572595 RepID=UPI0010AED87B|nr:hypothetical protein [Flavobacterium sp. ASW18X]TKD65973.1 hypothetical protein FBT53_03655 [Flavobacterium sp. ASW18X]
MRRFFKWTGIVVIVILIAMVTWGFITNEALPEGKAGPEADALAMKMLTSLNYSKYQNSRYLEWSFKNGANRYKWDKKMGKVTVTLEDTKIHLNLNAPKKSEVLDASISLSKEEKTALINKALDNFNNDSFWLVAPYKVFDNGVTRKVVSLDSGEKALLITYNSGGTTPGDSYLWLLNDNGFPNAFKMWVKIIPIGGVKATWDDWQVMDSGAFLPKTHQLGPITLNMGAIKAYN